MHRHSDAPKERRKGVRKKKRWRQCRITRTNEGRIKVSGVGKILGLRGSQKDKHAKKKSRKNEPGV